MITRDSESKIPATENPTESDDSSSVNYHIVSIPEEKIEEPIDVAYLRPPVSYVELSELKLSNLKSKNTSHSVEQAVRETETEIHNYFLKYNDKNANPVIAELEATAANFYRIIAPTHVYPTFPVYQNGACIGVASQAIPNFKSIAQDPLEIKDLDLTFMKEKGLSIETLDKLDDELHQLEYELESKQAIISKKLKLLEEEKAAILEKIDLFLKDDGISKSNGLVVDRTNTAQELMALNKKNANDTVELINERIRLGSEIPNLKKRMCEENNDLTAYELDKFRIVKGLAIGLTSSHIFMEDDLHRNNMQKDGKRIDFDMSLWPLLAPFKYRSTTENVFAPRAPNERTSIISAYDITNSPNFKDFAPCFWPTNAPTTYSSSTPDFIARYFPFNWYKAEDNQAFQQLKNNPVYKHFKYVTYTKYISTTPGCYYQIASNNITDNKNYEFENHKQPLAMHATDQQQARIEGFKKVLFEIPEYREFYEKNHEKIQQELLTELKKQGIEYPGDKILEKAKEALLPGKYEQIDKSIRKAMSCYFGYGFWNNWTRNHTNMANNLIKICDDLKKTISEGKDNNSTTYKTAISELYTTTKKTFINHKATVQTGEMLTTLTNLMIDLENIIPQEMLIKTDLVAIEDKTFAQAPQKAG